MLDMQHLWNGSVLLRLRCWWNWHFCPSTFSLSTFFFSCQYVELQHQPTLTPLLNLVGEACSLRRDEVESARRYLDRSILCGAACCNGVVFFRIKNQKKTFIQAERSTNQHKNTHVRCQCVVSIHVPRQIRPIMARKKKILHKQLSFGSNYIPVVHYTNWTGANKVHLFL